MHCSNLCPLLAEACGVREALSWLKNHDVQNVDIETNSLLVVNAVNSNAANLSPFGLVMFGVNCINGTITMTQVLKWYQNFNFFIFSTTSSIFFFQYYKFYFFVSD